MSNVVIDEEALAVKLALALTHLRARLREESSMNSAGLSITQLSILKRLLLDGQMTAASLATAEHISQQAIAQNIVPLKSAGLVKIKPDPTDGRKMLIGITKAGQRLRESLVVSRNTWLTKAIDLTINREDRAALDKAIELLERLADANP